MFLFAITAEPALEPTPSRLSEWITDVAYQRQIRRSVMLTAHLRLVSRYRINFTFVGLVTGIPLQ